ncbi:MAG: hypothetical protein ACPGLV_18855, partial [Bacteroidia bacterium]
MKNLLFIFLAWCTASCTTDEPTLQGPTWRVTRYTNYDNEITKNGIACLVTFYDSSAMVYLDVNQCFNRYELGKNGAVFFEENGGCTEACCDEPESIEAMSLLFKSTQF